MSDIKQEIAKVFLEKDNFLVSSFENEKIESISAILALGLVFKKLGKNVILFIPELPEINLSFLPTAEELKTEILGHNLIILINEKDKRLKKLNWQRIDNALRVELVPKEGDFGPQDISFAYGEQKIEYLIFLASPRYGAVKDLEKFREKSTINIDFHEDNELFGQFNWISKKSISMAEILLGLVETLETFGNKKIWDENLATLLYANLFWSTSGLRGTIPAKIFSMAAQLVSFGADKKRIEEAYEKRFVPEFYSLLGKIFQNSQSQNQKLISILFLDDGEKKWWEDYKRDILEEIKSKIFGLSEIYIIVKKDNQSEIWAYSEKEALDLSEIEWFVKTPPIFRGISSLEPEKISEILAKRIF